MSSDHSDVLSQVLKLIRLRGDYVFHGELGSSADVTFPPGPATFLHLRSGELLVSQRDGDPVLLQPGDFVLLPLQMDIRFEVRRAARHVNASRRM